MLCSNPLIGSQILIVKEHLAEAIKLEEMLNEAGGLVIGPAFSLEAAFHEMKYHSVHAAITDCHVDRQSTRPLTTALHEKRIPFIVHLVDGRPEPVPFDWVGARIMTRSATSCEELISTLTTLLSWKKQALTDREPSPQEEMPERASVSASINR